MAYSIFSLGESKLANNVARELNCEIAKSEYKVFPSKEILVKPIDSVRGQSIFILCGDPFPVNEKIMALCIFIDALKRASAEDINVIMPYFPYARQDRKSKPREPISASLVAKLLVTAGATRIVTTDLHQPQIQGFFTCLEDDLSALPLISDYLLKDLDCKNLTVVSPDHGGVTRARRVAKALSTPMVIIDKRRTEEYKPEVINIIGDVKNRDCVLVDDMIDTGGSCITAAKALKTQGCKKLYIAVTHPVFSDPFLENITKDNVFDKIYVTDSIPLDEKFTKSKLNIVVISLADLIAKAIKSIYDKKPMSEIYYN